MVLIAPLLHEENLNLNGKPLYLSFKNAVGRRLINTSYILTLQLGLGISRSKEGKVITGIYSWEHMAGLVEYQYP